MELIFLLLGIGLGYFGSRMTRSSNKPVGSTSPLLPQANSSEFQPPKKESKPLLEESQPHPEEAKPLETDIEPLKEELKQTKLAYEMAKEMSQFKGGFLARTAHELRSPLSSLIGMHQLILNDLYDTPEEAREFVAHANTSALKMVKILDEVIAVSKTEHGTNRLELLCVPLTQVFDDVHRLTHMQAANSNLQFEVVPPDPEIHVLADPRRFQQVLVGIVDAAIAQLADRKEGSIKVSGASFPEFHEVRVWIDVQSPTNAWSEAVDLLSTTPNPDEQPPQTSNISPGLMLLMAQTVIQVMQGRLEVLPISEEDSAGSSDAESSTRLQCSIPLATAETVKQALV
jgi:signal transduction histidine kinase